MSKEYKNKYAVFVDIDGVLTSWRVHFAHNASYKMWARFDPVAIDFFNKIHDEYNVEFIITSTWKNFVKENDMTIYHWMQSAFANSGFRGKFANPWKTNDINEAKNYMERGNEIKDYIDKYGEKYSDFIIFDDTPSNINEFFPCRFIQTDPNNGITWENMIEAYDDIINFWEKK